MTGFADETLKLNHGELIWELRSVNHRYLETHFRLPEAFRNLEPSLRKQVIKKIKRGKVDLVFRFIPKNLDVDKISINDSLAKQISIAANNLMGNLDSNAHINAIDILRWPGVVEKRTSNIEQLVSPVKELLNLALETLISNKNIEGKSIEEFLILRLNKISSSIKEIRNKLPEISLTIKNKIEERAKSLEIKIDNDRMEQELIILAQKLDIAEELDRIETHIIAAHKALESNEPIGRRLDFLMQEFNREANTISSKSADHKTTAIAVELKVLIEQMREQVQNLE
ncbi:MAG: YicC/YloC family endoribonuclease [Pseudomonadota bacterium]|nr:YicC/YloC family endoribonuclease [Pseudomonadota bacterium]